MQQTRMGYQEGASWSRKGSRLPVNSCLAAQEQARLCGLGRLPLALCREQTRPGQFTPQPLLQDPEAFVFLAPLSPPLSHLAVCILLIVPLSSSLQDQTPSLLPCRLLRLPQDPTPSLPFIFSSFYFLKLLLFF